MSHRGRGQVRSMTQGSPARLLLRFALPLMAGNVCQQLYTVTDTAIVGQALGVAALAALGSVEWFSWLAVGVIQGVTQGFSIRVAQRFGAGDLPGMRRTVGHCAVLSALFAAVLTALLQMSLRGALRVCGVPEAIRPVAQTYLRVLFCGIPVVTAYNLLASTLRALGDSRTPLAAMLIASGVNIVLDVLFVIGLGWGVAGAAAATVLAQLLSALFCLVRLSGIELIRLDRKDLRPRADECRPLFRLALPMAFQNLVIAVGGMVVQIVVNRYGVTFIAGYTATSKLYGLLEVACVSYGFAMTTFIAQNRGAGDVGRICAGLRSGVVIALITSAVIAALMIAFGRAILGLFIQSGGEDAPAAMAVAYRLLTIMSLCLPILYALHVVRSCIQGLGNTVVPMISGLAEFAMRTGTSLLLPLWMGETGILFAEVAAWLGADLVLIPGCARELSKLNAQ